MIHHFDHRFGYYPDSTADDTRALPRPSILQKQNPNYEVTPRYWLPHSEVALRSARVPAALKRSVREKNSDDCLKLLSQWLVGYFRETVGRVIGEADLVEILGRDKAWRSVLGTSPDRFLSDPKSLTRGIEMQRDTPLVADDIAFLNDSSENSLALAISLIERKQPRWLMGWRDITNSTNERTVIATVLGTVGTGDKLLLMNIRRAADAAMLLGLLTSLTLDFVARQKFSSTSFKYHYMKQLAVLPPNSFTEEEFSFVISRVLELTYTSRAMQLWANDLEYYAQPFFWDEARRAQLRAELDALFARKYGLGRDDLRYILDPTDIRGPDYPSETFRALKAKDIRLYGEYRTGKLVLDAWDRLAANNIGEKPAEIRLETTIPRVLRDNAWARPMPASPGDAGAMLAAILKAMDEPMPARQVRLAATFGLEPRLLLPHLDPDQAAEWQRLIGAEAALLTGNAASFAPRADRTWGSAVTAHRGNGRLVEDLTTGTWAPGLGLDAVDTAGWPDGRAGMLMRVLPHIATDAVISAMPAEIRGWIDAAAA